MTLAIIGLICKIIGLFFKLPIIKILGDSGYGIYEKVYPTYSLLLTISSAGLPVAVSRMVAHYVNKNDPRNAKKIFHVALGVLALLGFVSMVAMVFFRAGFARWVNSDETVLGFVMIAPAVLIVCVMSAFRGFLQGQQEMGPTAFSQLIEQVAKVAVGLPLAIIGMKMGEKLNLPPYAAGATLTLLAISISEGLALIYIYVKYVQNKKVFRQYQQQGRSNPLTTKTAASRLMAIALPITIGACIVPLSGFIDSGMITGLLLKAGFEQKLALEVYGRYMLVITYINIPTALAIAVSMATVPAMSAGIAQNVDGYVGQQSHLSLRYGFVIGFPASVGMSILAEPLVRLFFNNQHAPHTASMLQISALTIVFFTIVQVTSSILQGLRKQRIPMYTLMVGVLAKIILNQILVPIEKVNIYGASISSLACYIISMVPNLYYVIKYTKMKLDIKTLLFRPLLATLAMGGTIYLFQKLLPARMIMTLVLVGIGVISYVGYSLLFKSITKEDLAFLTKRERGKEK